LALLLTAASLAWPALAEEPTGLSEAIRAYSRETATPQFEYALVDLNDDGTLDAVVLLTGRDWCGSGGCSMLILRGHSGGFSVVSRSTISNQPIKVSAERQHGWHTLLVSVKGGGIQRGFVVMPFNGSKYPLNPSMQARATSTQADAATTLTFRKGDTP
jgi:hypothetical protein